MDLHKYNLPCAFAFQKQITYMHIFRVSPCNLWRQFLILYNFTMTEVMPKPKTYVFEWRLWERILSRVGQVSFACSPSKVAMRVRNLTVETRVSPLVTQGHFGQIRSGCQVAINSPPPTTINGWLLRLRVWLLSYESNPPRSLWERIPCEDKALTTQSQRVLGIT